MKVDSEQGYAIFTDKGWWVDKDTRSLLSTEATLYSQEVDAKNIAKRANGEATEMERIKK